MSTSTSARRKALWGIVLVLVAASAVWALFLSPEPAPKSSKPGYRSADSSETGFQRATPGLRKTEYGRAQALGTVRYVDLEGGFWAIVDEIASEDKDAPRVVAVIPNAEDVDLPEFEGQFVAVNGTLSEGASIRMAGPELIAEEVFVPH